ncbi:MAG: dATP pyrophosphohydrolase, partial [Gammaproteobacteria bacterium CG22_combo_CG10-13_8_21_14_all_40_8]
MLNFNHGFKNMPFESNVNTELKIIPVNGKSDLVQFIAIPNLIFKNDAAWIQPLILERSMLLSPKYNPYFEHAQWQAWIAWRGETPVGRISAQIDD